MDAVFFGAFIWLLPACILPAFVTLVALHSFKKFQIRLQGMGMFWSILVTLVVLELGKTVVLQLAPWLYHLEMGDFIMIAPVGIAPLCLVTFAIFRLFKASFFVEQSSVEILQWSLFVAVTTVVFIVFKAYEVKSIAEIIGG